MTTISNVDFIVEPGPLRGFTIEVSFRNSGRVWASSGRHGRHLGVAHWTTVVINGQPWSFKTGSKHWPLDETSWSGRRESNSRSQLGKLMFCRCTTPAD